MKKIITLLVMLLVSVFVVAVQVEQANAAESGKIGYVDLQKAMNTSEHGKNVRMELEGMVNEKSKEIEKLASQRDALQQDLQKNRLGMAESAVRERLDEIKKLERRAERVIGESNEDLGKLQREKELGILKELDVIITKIGLEDNYSIIIPAEMVLFAHESQDVTEEVIKRYNASKGLKPSKK